MDKEKNRMGRGKKFLFWLGGIIFIGGLIGTFSDSDSKTPAEPETAEIEQEEKAQPEVKENEPKADEKKEEPKEVKKNKKKDKEESKPTAIIEGYEERIAEVISDSEGIILEIRPNEVSENYQQMEIVIDGNEWEASSKTDKIQFAEAVADAVGRALQGYGVIELGTSVQYTILDQNGYELAKKGIMSSKFKIKR